MLCARASPIATRMVLTSFACLRTCAAPSAMSCRAAQVLTLAKILNAQALYGSTWASQADRTLVAEQGKTDFRPPEDGETSTAGPAHRRVHACGRPPIRIAAHDCPASAGGPTWHPLILRCGLFASHQRCCNGSAPHGLQLCPASGSSGAKRRHYGLLRTSAVPCHCPVGHGNAGCPRILMPLPGLLSTSKPKC